MNILADPKCRLHKEVKHVFSKINVNLSPSGDNVPTLKNPKTVHNHLCDFSNALQLFNGQIFHEFLDFSLVQLKKGLPVWLVEIRANFSEQFITSNTT